MALLKELDQLQDALGSMPGNRGPAASVFASLKVVRFFEVSPFSIDKIKRVLGTRIDYYLLTGGEESKLPTINEREGEAIRHRQ